MINFWRWIAFVCSINALGFYYFDNDASVTIIYLILCAIFCLVLLQEKGDKNV